MQTGGASRPSRLAFTPRLRNADAVLAYLDPGTGSMLVQLLVGGVAAAGVAAKLYWRRLMRLLRIRRDDPPALPPEPDRDG